MELKKKINNLNNEINNLKYKLDYIGKENDNIKKENIQLKNEKNNLLLTIQNLQYKLNEETKNNNRKNINLNYNNNSNNSSDKSKIIELLNEKLQMKDKEIKELKKKIENNSNNIDNLMTVIFYSTDHKIHYSLICKKTDSFMNIEKKLFEAYPECQNSEYFFMVNGQRIKRFKTLEENKINNSQVITLTQYDFE